MNNSNNSDGDPSLLTVSLSVTYVLKINGLYIKYLCIYMIPIEESVYSRTFKVDFSFCFRKSKFISLFLFCISKLVRRVRIYFASCLCILV